jgi:hypothetical protein
MIAEGGDGVSRGSLNEGVMLGVSMLSFIPLHLSALERSPPLLEWIKFLGRSFRGGFSSGRLVRKGHDIRGWAAQRGELIQRPIIKAGVYGWFLPPAVADVAIEQLRIARVKRQDSSHVFVCPRLLCPYWLKQLHKACDLVFKVPAGASDWPLDMFEPLLIGVCFPFLRPIPWQFRGTPKVSWLARKLHDMRKDLDVDRGIILRKFWDVAHRLRDMPEYMVSKMLYFGSTDPISCGPTGGSKRKSSGQ